MSNSKSSSSEPRPGPLQRSVVKPAEAGLRLDKWLAVQPELPSREAARRLIDQGAVKLNAESASPSVRLRASDVVEYHVPAPVAATVLPESGRLEIVHEDDWLVVIDKAPGVAMHPAPGVRSGTLVNFLLAHCENLSGIGGVLRPGIVHRLDRGTSGLVVVAKHDRAHAGLSAQFKAHSVERAYTALVIGQPPGVVGTISLPLGRHPSHRLKQRVWPGGRPAVTHWKVERRFAHFARLRLTLETGRTHQIRVHLAHQGWPVLCDPLYSGGRHKGLALPEPLRRLLQDFSRQALHAGVLGFDHPRTGERMSFSAPLPPDMARVEQSISALAPAEAAKPTPATKRHP